MREMSGPFSRRDALRYAAIVSGLAGLIVASASAGSPEAMADDAIGTVLFTGGVIWTGTVDHLVLRRFALVAGGPFLQRAFGRLGVAGMAFHRIGPQTANDITGGVKTVFQQARAQQSLHDVAQHIVAIGSAIIACLAS